MRHYLCLKETQVNQEGQTSIEVNTIKYWSWSYCDNSVYRDKNGKEWKGHSTLGKTSEKI